ncbi:hypothetical protein HYC85_025808 [Camellia sinensis]|uniref:Uncharacterized protein n=1 Tax=Camellia sinensis TaxID=4442 RepID=A0A7J7GC66_CAMSI|nr:hypothetical protein HYC85_025808 [Camellia sinensis]
MPECIRNEITLKNCDGIKNTLPTRVGKSCAPKATNLCRSCCQNAMVLQSFIYCNDK